MEKRLEEIREQQKATWNKFSPGWKKWDDITMHWIRPMGDEIIRLIHHFSHEFFPAELLPHEFFHIVLTVLGSKCFQKGLTAQVGN